MMPGPPNGPQGKSAGGSPNALLVVGPRAGNFEPGPPGPGGPGLGSGPFYYVMNPNEKREKVEFDDLPSLEGLPMWQQHVARKVADASKDPVRAYKWVSKAFDQNVDEEEGIMSAMMVK